MKPNIGDRVRITGILPDDPNPLPIGTEGTVDYLGQWTDELTKQIGVKWDNGSRLLLLHTDPFKVIRPGPRVGVVKMSDIAAHPTHRMDAEYWLDRQESGTARGSQAPPESSPG